VMVNGLDFFPTVLSLTGSAVPAGKRFDGCDLSQLLRIDPTDSSLIREPGSGKVRDTMVWHFPNSSTQESTIRVGDYKLVRNYFDKPKLELYRLYSTGNSKHIRNDIEEAKNLAESMPEKTAELNQRLTEILTEMNASYPYYNPRCPRLPKRIQAPTVLSSFQSGNTLNFIWLEKGAKVVRANLIYTTNGGDRNEEWFRTPAMLTDGSRGSVTLPKGTTHYIINLIDSNDFLVSYPEIDPIEEHQTVRSYSAIALKAE